MSKRTQRVCRFWFITILVLITIYEASHLIAVGGANTGTHLAFLGLLVASFITVGLSAEILVENPALRRLTLASFYAVAAGLFLCTSLIENRQRLIQHIEWAQAAELFDQTAHNVRDNSAALRLKAVTELSALRAKLGALQSKINVQVDAVGRLKTAKAQVREMEPANFQVLADAKHALAASRRILNAQVASRSQISKRISRIQHVTAGCDALMQPYIRQPSEIPEMEQKRLQLRDRLYALQLEFGAEPGKAGEPEVVPPKPRTPSPFTIYRWALMHADDNAVAPLWKALLLNGMLGALAFLVGHMAHTINHCERATVQVIGRNRGSRAA